MYSQQGCILGSVSGGSYDNVGLTKYSYYVDLQSQSSKSLLNNYKLGAINAKLPEEYKPTKPVEPATQEKKENEDIQPEEC